VQYSHKSKYCSWKRLCLNFRWVCKKRRERDNYNY